jgi:hypothetical protein
MTVTQISLGAQHRLGALEQASVPAGHENCLFSNSASTAAALLPPFPRLTAWISRRLMEVSCLVRTKNGGLMDNTVDSLANILASSSSNSFRGDHPPSKSARALLNIGNWSTCSLKPQYSGKNFSLSSSLIFFTATGACPAKI